MQFRGREMSHSDIGMGIINKCKDLLEEIAKVDNPPKMEGRQIFMVLSPK